MPGTYPQYANTPEGMRKFNFWANLRVSFGCSLALVYLTLFFGYGTVGVAGAVVLVIIATAIAFAVVFKQNLGGRLYAKMGLDADPDRS